MKYNPRRSSRLRALAVVGALLALTAACGNAETGTPGATKAPEETSTDDGPNESPGVTEDEIKFASFGTGANNPLGTCLQECFDTGVKAYFDWRNSEGGVHGRKLVLSEQLDDQLAKNKEMALEIISKDEVFATFSAPLLASGFEDMAQAGIPTYALAISFSSMDGKENVYGDRAVLCVKCIDRFFPFAAKQAGAKKIGTVGYTEDQSAKDCVATIDSTVTKYSKETGQSMGYKNDTLNFGLANGIAPEVTAMKNAKVDFVGVCMDLNGVKTLEQEMERQGMGKVPVLQSNTYDADFIKSNASLFEGDLVQVSFRPFEANPGKSQLNTYKEWMGKSGAKITETSMQGWINANTAYEGIKAAGPKFTRASVIAATNKMTEYTAGGMIGPVDWSRQHKAWTDADPITNGPKLACRSFVRVKNGTMELVGDKDKPFWCYKPDNLSTWSDPIAMNFE